MVTTQFCLYRPVCVMAISYLSMRLSHFQEGPSLSSDCEDLMSASSEKPKIYVFRASSPGKVKLIRFSSHVPQSALLV